MSLFSSDDRLYTVLQAVFERVQEDPANVESFTNSNLVIRILFTDLDAEVLLDGRQPPMEIFYGETPGDANIEINLTSELLHHIWLGEQNIQRALFMRKIKTKGNIMKAVSLFDLFQECERVYPEIAKAHGVGG
ncbi:MAG: SCP2 sterol-binding domain-containing protein [Chloroflexota bacterium]